MADDPVMATAALSEEEARHAIRLLWPELFDKGWEGRQVRKTVMFVAPGFDGDLVPEPGESCFDAKTVILKLAEEKPDAVSHVVREVLRLRGSTLSEAEAELRVPLKLRFFKLRESASVSSKPGKGRKRTSSVAASSGSLNSPTQDQGKFSTPTKKKGSQSTNRSRKQSGEGSPVSTPFRLRGNSVGSASSSTKKFTDLNGDEIRFPDLYAWLKESGWDAKSGRGIINWYYYPPGTYFERGAPVGDLNKDYFTDSDEVIRFVSQDFEMLSRYSQFRTEMNQFISSSSQSSSKRRSPTHRLERNAIDALSHLTGETDEKEIKSTEVVKNTSKKDMKLSSDGANGDKEKTKSSKEKTKSSIGKRKRKHSETSSRNGIGEDHATLEEVNQKSSSKIDHRKSTSVPEALTPGKNSNILKKTKSKISKKEGQVSKKAHSEKPNSSSEVSSNISGDGSAETVDTMPTTKKNRKLELDTTVVSKQNVNSPTKEGFPVKRSRSSSDINAGTMNSNSTPKKNSILNSIKSPSAVENPESLQKKNGSVAANFPLPRFSLNSSGAFASPSSTLFSSQSTAGSESPQKRQKATAFGDGETRNGIEASTEIVSSVVKPPESVKVPSELDISQPVEVSHSVSTSLSSNAKSGNVESAESRGLETATTNGIGLSDSEVDENYDDPMESGVDLFDSSETKTTLKGGDSVDLGETIASPVDLYRDFDATYRPKLPSNAPAFGPYLQYELDEKISVSPTLFKGKKMVVFGVLDEETLSFVEKFGGKLVNLTNQSTDQVLEDLDKIMTEDGPDLIPLVIASPQFSLTMSGFSVLAVGHQILHPNYIRECVISNRILGVKSFVLPAGPNAVNNESAWVFGKRSRKRCLEGIRVHLLPCHSYRQMRGLLTLAGAELVPAVSKHAEFWVADGDVFTNAGLADIDLLNRSSVAPKLVSFDFVFQILIHQDYGFVKAQWQRPSFFCRSQRANCPYSLFLDANKNLLSARRFAPSGRENSGERSYTFDFVRWKDIRIMRGAFLFVKCLDRYHSLPRLRIGQFMKIKSTVKDEDRTESWVVMRSCSYDILPSRMLDIEVLDEYFETRLEFVAGIVPFVTSKSIEDRFGEEISSARPILLNDMPTSLNLTEFVFQM